MQSTPTRRPVTPALVACPPGSPYSAAHGYVTDEGMFIVGARPGFFDLYASTEAFTIGTRAGLVFVGVRSLDHGARLSADLHSEV